MSCGIGLRARPVSETGRLPIGTGTTRNRPLPEGASVNYPLLHEIPRRVATVRTDTPSTSTFVSYACTWSIRNILGVCV